MQVLSTRTRQYVEKQASLFARTHTTVYLGAHAVPSQDVSTEIRAAVCTCPPHNGTRNVPCCFLSRRGGLRGSDPGRVKWVCNLLCWLECHLKTTETSATTVLLYRYSHHWGHKMRESITHYLARTQKLTTFI